MPAGQPATPSTSQPAGPPVATSPGVGPLAGRFAIDRAIGQGGMAVVYRAIDLHTQTPVAVKLLHATAQSPYVVDHFLGEAQILASLHHPHIVRYIAHGRTEAGDGYLAMEWLQGEDLATRLGRQPLTLNEALQLTQIIADVLSLTHAQGIVHRDLKPPNLFLPGGQLEQVKLLDFGVARQIGAARPLTQTGVIVGTPEYMAPEQVRGERRVGPSADIFALGCVLYECLAGRPPFCGEHFVATLAKILFEQARDIRELRPQLPPSLATLLSRMLAKDAGDRPGDAGTVGATLRAIVAELPPELTHQPPPTRQQVIPGRAASLASELLELLSVVVASATGAGHDPTATLQLATQATLVQEQSDLLSALRALGAQADFLLDGTLVAVLRGFASAADQAERAAQAALLIHTRWADAHIAVTLGRGVRPGELPMGEVLDRAARMLVADTVAAGAGPADGEIRIDAATAGLLSGKYDIRPKSAAVFSLRPQGAPLDESKPLLGKPTPCVGRDRELSLLDTTLSTCIDEPQAQAMVVLAPPGYGKSRLRHEFTRRVARAHPSAQILLARGSAMAEGTPFALLGQALRALCGVQEGADPSDAWRRFSSRIGRALSVDAQARLLAPLAELCHIAAPADIATALRFARQNPSDLLEQLRQSFIEFLQAECAEQPVVLILEDVHWGDAPSLDLLDIALRDLAEQPLFVLALGRPDVDDRFPKLWRTRRHQQLRLGPLSNRACQQLIDGVLGQRLSPAQRAQLITQAAGNALFLEELIRSAAEGGDGAVPETVLAMLQARLGRLDAGVRAASCAASVFGGVFWQAGVVAMLRPMDDATVADLLTRLVDLEIAGRHNDTRLSGQVEYGFRHDLMRQAAYGLLSDDGRRLAHRLAADYLAGAGESDALVLAEHYRLGQVAERAVHWYRRAAEQALDTNDLDGARARAQRGLDLQPGADERSRLYTIQATAANWARDDGETLRCATAAIADLPPGGASWYENIAHLLVVSGRRGDRDAMACYMRLVQDAPTVEAAQGARVSCLARAGFAFLVAGHSTEMGQIAGQLRDVDVSQLAADPLARAQLFQFRSGCAYSNGDLVSGVRNMAAAVDAFDAAGDRRSALQERATLASNLLEMGDHVAAERLARISLHDAQQARVLSAFSLARIILAHALSFRPDGLGEAEGLLTAAVAAGDSPHARRHHGWAEAAMARLRYLQGRYAECESMARAALGHMGAGTTMRVWPLGWLARALIQQGEAAAGLAIADEALALLKTQGRFTVGASLPPLARIEALRALRRVEEYGKAVVAAQRGVGRFVERIADPHYRACFLAKPELAQILALPDTLQPADDNSATT